MPNRAAVFLSAALLGLTLFPAPVFPAPPAGRGAALADLGASNPARRAEAIVWFAGHGTAKDGKLLYPRLRDESPRVRDYAETALWALWSRSGDPALDALLARGVEEMNGGRLRRAIADCRQVLERNPRHFGALSGLGQIYLALGDDAQALAWFRRALAVDPDLAGVALTIKALEDRIERRRDHMI